MPLAAVPTNDRQSAPQVRTRVACTHVSITLPAIPVDHFLQGALLAGAGLRFWQKHSYSNRSSSNTRFPGSRAVHRASSMSDKSPLFVSANELLAHAVDLYTSGNERKYKFVILHLANAIELILKDRVIDLGTSIYKGQSTQTIGIWDAFTALTNAGITVPERPIIELLVDDRNTIQHRFGFPNGDAVFYYLQHVLGFFRRFLQDEYQVDLVEVLRLHISDDALATIGLVDRRDESAPLDKLFALSPEAAVLQSFRLIEERVLRAIYADADNRDQMQPAWSSLELPMLLEAMSKRGLLDRELVGGFRHLRMMRNRAAHAAHFPNEVPREEWSDALALGKRVLKALDDPKVEEFLKEGREELQALIRERHGSRYVSVSVLKSDQPPTVPAGAGEG